MLAVPIARPNNMRHPLAIPDGGRAVAGARKPAGGPERPICVASRKSISVAALDAPATQMWPRRLAKAGPQEAPEPASSLGARLCH